jgi:hypothetical protein
MMKHTEGTGNPFLDGPALEQVRLGLRNAVVWADLCSQPSLSKVDLIIHLFAVSCTVWMYKLQLIVRGLDLLHVSSYMYDWRGRRLSSQVDSGLCVIFQPVLPGADVLTAGGTGFVLFLLIIAFLLSVILVVVPIIYDR